VGCMAGPAPQSAVVGELPLAPGSPEQPEHASRGIVGGYTRALKETTLVARQGPSAGWQVLGVLSLFIEISCVLEVVARENRKVVLRRVGTLGTLSPLTHLFCKSRGRISRNLFRHEERQVVCFWVPHRGRPTVDRCAMPCSSDLGFGKPLAIAVGDFRIKDTGSVS